MMMRQIAYIAQLGGHWVGRGDGVLADEQVLQDNEDDEEANEEWEGGGRDNYLDAFGAHFEPSSSWTEPMRGRIGYADAGWEVGTRMMVVASGFVTRSTSRSCSPPTAHRARARTWRCFRGGRGGGNGGEGIGEGKGPSATRGAWLVMHTCRCGR